MKQLKYLKPEHLLFWPVLILSFLANYLIFVRAGRRYTVFQSLVGIKLPILVIVPMIFIGVLIKGVLRGNFRETFVQLDLEDSRAMLEKEDNSFKKSLIRLYILIYIPFYLLIGWFMASGLFAQLLAHTMDHKKE